MEINVGETRRYLQPRVACRRDPAIADPRAPASRRGSADGPLRRTHRLAAVALPD
jgi:hypothetical protein